MIPASEPALDFEAVLASARAELHRYCARLMGSVFDGEDIVQDVMLRALAAADTRPADALLRPWLFRIAHNRAIDVFRARENRERLLATELGLPLDDILDPHEVLARQQAVTLAIERFVELPTLQRSVVILKDVLGETNAEIGDALGLTLQSVKAHLHRGRARIFELTGTSATQSSLSAEARPETQRYTALFQARDWAGLRLLLAGDVRLVQSAKGITDGRSKVARQFFGGYAATADWTLRPGVLEGHEIVWVDSLIGGASYLMKLNWRSGLLATIVDFRYARYIASSSLR